ncbi:MAG TPA: hypothetical protein PK402_03480, partial [Tepidisphaeraceae bacterium]|nr:hypothetical protein [Tepidisphaeraceae bacterium]
DRVHTVVRSARRGMASLMAMFFVVLVGTLAIALYSTSNTNMISAYRHADAARAQAAADSALDWFNFRLETMSLPVTSTGNITDTVADSLWPIIRTSITNDLQSMATSGSFVTYNSTTNTLTTQSFKTSSDDAESRIEIRQHPLDESDPLDERYLRITATGSSGLAERSVSVDFIIDKKIRFAVVSKTRIQLGRNVLVEGPMGMPTASLTPPFQILSDFTHLNSTLASRISSFQTFCEATYKGFDNRIPVGSTAATQAAAQGFSDQDGDGYVDEFDLFLEHYDTNNDAAVSKAEFTDSHTGKLVDPNLFAAIDGLGAQLSDTDVMRYGYKDDKLDSHDGYAKVRGQVSMGITQNSWKDNLASQGKTIQDLIPGPIVPDRNDQAPVKFGATSSDIFNLDPANFELCAATYRTKSGTGGGTTKRITGRIENATLGTSDANGGTVTERSPFGSVSYQATYKRPVFKNLTLKNVIIPKGLNALFENCTFEGVTFVDTEATIKTSSGATTKSQTDGSSWAQRKISGDTFSKDKVLISTGTPSSGQTISQGSKNGNNLRFHNCTIKGPIANNYSTAYTHFANSWEFTGSTLFDNAADDTATIVAPQTNIEMGSFTNPDAAPSTLTGVVVAGNIDIRGTSVVDGSIIVTGDGAGNTTLGYFGSSDGDTNPTAMPEGGFGRLNLRYNPNRALPDGISLPIEISPVAGTYREGE